jgi:hypothetical protein
MLPETLVKIRELLEKGANVVTGKRPEGVVTLKNGADAEKRFNDAIRSFWELDNDNVKGEILDNVEIGEALRTLNIEPDVIDSVKENGALWSHRKVANADWYYVTAPKGGSYDGMLNFRCTGAVEIWDPVSGEIHKTVAQQVANNRTQVKLELPNAGAVFVIFRHDVKSQQYSGLSKQQTVDLTKNWTLQFPQGTDSPAKIELTELKAWKDLDISAEAKAFSGTASYTKTFELQEVKPETKYVLDLGKVEIAAEVTVNGKKLRPLWTTPYKVDITSELKQGTNELKVEITSTWFNRLVYDNNQPEENRKTWTINPPQKESPLRESGLLGPVVIEVLK